MKSMVVSVRITPTEHEALSAIAAVSGGTIHTATKAAVSAYIAAGGSTPSAAETARILAALSDVTTILRLQGNLFAYALKSGRTVDPDLVVALRSALDAVRGAATDLIR